MRLLLLITIGLLGFGQLTYSQVAGCMDPAASNYNASATVSDGSCNYPDATASLSSKGAFTSVLNEISGMTLVGGKLYAHTDSGTPNVIYEIDTTSRAILKTITLAGTTNVDWEDITNDGTYLYIGDFGNNSNGARTNLRIYRVPIAAVNAISGASGTVAAGDIDVINFTYEDQPQPPTATGSNTTAFDCESVIYNNGYLYLFTKNWVDTTTSEYRMPASPGSHIAQKMGEFDTQGVLITSAAMANENIVLLLGYSVSGSYPGAVWMVTGFSDMDHLFQTGNKRKIDLGSAAINGQIEAITAVNQTWSLVSNEQITITSPFTFTVSPKLQTLDLQAFTPQYVLPLGFDKFTARYNDNTVYLSWQYNDAVAVKEFVVEGSDKADGSYSVIGRLSAVGNQQGYEFVKDGESITGTRYYRIKIVSLDGMIQYSKVLPLKNNSGQAFDIKASPVPFNDRINIGFYSDTPQLVQLNLLDLSGRILRSQKLQVVKGSYSFEIDGLFDLAKGVYILRATTPRHNFVRKILKQ